MQVFGAFVVLLAGIPVAIGHLRNVLDALSDLVRRRTLLAGAAGDFLDRSDRDLAFLLDFVQRITRRVRRLA